MDDDLSAMRELAFQSLHRQADEGSAAPRYNYDVLLQKGNGIWWTPHL
jgi:hypothetical protein